MGNNPDWFPEIKVNYSQAILNRGKDSDIALQALCQGPNRMRQRTFSQLREEVFLIASCLRNAGLQEGDVVSAYLPNCIETVEIMLATVSLGAVWSSTGTEFGSEGASDRFNQVKPKFIFLITGYEYRKHTISMIEKNNRLIESLDVKPTKVIYIPYLEWHDQTVLKHFTDLNFDKTDISYKLSPIPLEMEKNLLVTSQITKILNEKIISSITTSNISTTTWFDFLTIDDAEIRRKFTMVPFRHPSFILFSSGTSGKPKCIVHSGGSTLLKHAEEQMLQVNTRPTDRVLFFTSVGWMMWNWLLGSLYTGCRVILYEGCSLQPDIWPIIDNLKISIFGVGAAWLDVIRKNNVDLSNYSLDRLRVILSTGSPLYKENFKFVYEKIKRDLLLGSISGGTDMIGCCVGCSTMLPVNEGQIQCSFLGMDVRCLYTDVEIIDEFTISKSSMSDKKGELIIAKVFPTMPVYFINDPNGKMFKAAYFSKSLKFWLHGDYLSFDEETLGITIFGRSDAVLNPKGVRFGSAEIYNVLNKIEEINDSLCIGQEWNGSERVILFYQLSDDLSYSEDMSTKIEQKIKAAIKSSLSTKHLPELYFKVSGIPYTQNNKKVEIPMKKFFQGLPKARAFENLDALRNPGVIDEYEKILHSLT